MRAKWMLLTKLQLTGLLGINRARKSQDPRARRKAAGGLAAFIVVGIVLLLYVALFAIGMCAAGLTKQVPAVAVALASAITFFFSLMQGCSVLFAVKDYDMLMSLPVSKRTVVASRMLCSYLINLLFCAGVMVPVAVIFFIFDGFSFVNLLVILAAAACTPLLPVVVATALSTLITAATAGFRFKNLLQSIVGILFIVLIMIGSFSFSFSMNTDPAAGVTVIADVLTKYVYPPALLVNMTIAGEAFWGIFAFIGISLAAGGAFVAAVSPFYTKINSALFNHGARVGYKKSDVKRTSAFGALCKREWKRLFSSSAYLLNGVSGTVLLILAGIALLFVDVRTVMDALLAEAATEAPEVAEALQNCLPYMATGLAVLFIGMSCPSASALSMEGKSRGILFSMPVSARTIFFAKALPTFVLNLAGGAFVSVVFCAKIGAAWDGWLALLGTCLVFSAFTAIGGIWLNYKNPKYEWTTEQEVVKNSMPVWLAVLGSFVLGFAVLFLSVFGWYAVAAFNAVCIVLCAAMIAYFGKVRLYV